MSDDIDTWRISFSHPDEMTSRMLKVYSPGCPAVPHAERHCKCRTFRRIDRAEAYIEEQSRSVGHD